MSVDPSDLELKRIINEYNAAPDAVRFERIVEKLSGLVLNYPAKAHDRSEEDCSSFYEYMLERLPSILKSYKTGDARFTTWFMVVLRTRFLNWIRDSSSMDDASAHAVPVKKTVHGTQFEIDISDGIQYDKWRGCANDESRGLPDILNTAMKLLAPERKTLLYLLYGEVNAESLLKLGLAPERCTELANKAARAGERIAERRADHLRRLSSINLKLALLRKKRTRLSQNMTLPSQERGSKLKTLDACIGKHKKNAIKTMREASGMKLNMPYNLAAEILGWNLSRIKHEVTAVLGILREALSRKDPDNETP